MKVKICLLLIQMNDGTWMEWNSKYSYKWPNITEARPEDVLADKIPVVDVTMSEEPGKGD